MSSTCERRPKQSNFGNDAYTMDTMKVLFGSNEWIEMASRVLAELVVVYADRIQDQSITICEVFEKVPAELTGARSDGARAWHFSVKRGKLSVNDGELDADQSDMKVVYDYQAVLPLARKVYVDEPGDAELVQAYCAELARGGRLKTYGGRAKIPADLSKLLSELHNQMARMTI